jgi:hypothetical protein
MVFKTTGARTKNVIKECFISLIEYKSNEVGFSVYNLTTGEIFLAQII